MIEDGGRESVPGVGESAPKQHHLSHESRQGPYPPRCDQRRNQPCGGHGHEVCWLVMAMCPSAFSRTALLCNGGGVVPILACREMLGDPATLPLIR